MFRVASAEKAQGILSAKAQAREILSAARHEAARIVEEARGEARRQLSRARRVGFESGAEKASKVLLENSEKHRSALLGSEREIAELVISLAREVVGAELESRPESITARIARALDRISHPLRLRLLVHPSRVDTVSKGFPSLDSGSNSPVEIAVEADPGLDPHDAKIQSGLCCVTASIDTHLKAISDYLRQSNSIKLRAVRKESN